MKKILTKTNISLLSIVICAMLFCCAFAINAFNSKNVQMAHAYEPGSSATLKGQDAGVESYNNKGIWFNLIDYNIENLIITNSFDISKSIGEPVDVSEAQDKTLYAYKVDIGNEKYNCVIYANVEKIYAPVNSTRLFTGTTNTANPYTPLSYVKTIKFENNCFDTSNTVNMYEMFYKCAQLQSLNVNVFNTSKTTTMNYMFAGCTALTSLTISNFNTTNVTGMGGMFEDCRKLTSLDLRHFVTDNVVTMYNMFSGCWGLTSLDISSFNTSKVKDMERMFGNCSSLTSLDVSNFDTTNVTKMQYMFYWCSKIVNLDVSNFVMDNVADASYMFKNCEAVKNLDVSNFNTSNIKNMNFMFSGCKSITTLDVSNFETSQVTDMAVMFSECDNLKSLDLSNFETTGIENFNRMFEDCFSLVSIDCSSFDTTSATAIGGTFRNCKSLETLNISSFVINSNANVNEMLLGTGRLKKIHAPKECNVSIDLPKPYFMEQGTTTEYANISNATNNKILIYNPSFIELDANFSSLLTAYNIENLTITNDISKKINNPSYAIDVSYYKDGYLMANISGKNCVMYCELPIYAPNNASELFAIASLKTLNLEGLNTSNTTDMSNMFISKGHDFTIKGLCNFMAVLQGGESQYVEGMTFIEFAVVGGMTGTYETEEEAQSAIESQLGITLAKSGEYDIALKALAKMGLSISTFSDFHSMFTGAACTHGEEECRLALNDVFACEWTAEQSVVTLNNLTSLDISNFVINEGTNTENMLFGLNNLKTLYAPVECNEEVELPISMVEKGTSNEHLKLSSESNGKTLVLQSGGSSTPTTGFVDEQLLPMIAISLISIMAVFVLNNITKKEI